MILSNLADVARRSGLNVIEVPGWRTRGHGGFDSIEAVICHHTATPSRYAGDYPTMGVVKDGRPGLDGPLAQLGLGRSGTVYVIAAGVAWHAGATFSTWQNNWHAIGIEAEDDGTGPWDQRQYQAYVRLVRALCDGYKIDVGRVKGHKEVAKPLGRKPDPTFSMTAFRAAVRKLGTFPHDDSPEDYMASNDALARLDRIQKTLDGIAAQQDAEAKVELGRYQVDARRYQEFHNKLNEGLANDASEKQFQAHLEKTLASMADDPAAPVERA